RSEEHTSELQSHLNLVCRLLLEIKAVGEDADQTHARGYRRVPSTVDNEVEVGRCFFNDTATTEIYTLSLHDALPILMAAQAYDVFGDKAERDKALRKTV